MSRCVPSLMRVVLCFFFNHEWMLNFVECFYHEFFVVFSGSTSISVIFLLFLDCLFHLV